MPSTGRRLHRPVFVGGRAVLLLLSLATAGSFLLILQNFGLDVLPDRRVEVSAKWIRDYTQEKSFAYVFDFSGSEPDRWPSARSRVEFYEGSYRYPRRL